MKSFAVPGSKVATVTSGQWREAFERQCTEDLLKNAKRFAAQRARAVSKAGGIADDYYVHELVQDVLGDTFLGVLQWNPNAESLEDHVKDAIASRVSHDLTHARRFPRESFDALNTDTDAAATLAAVDASLLAAREPAPATATLADDACAQLLKLVIGDAALVAVLDAFIKGATTKADVMFLTGISDKEYHAARCRLDRLVAKLSPIAKLGRRRRLKRRA